MKKSLPSRLSLRGKKSLYEDENFPEIGAWDNPEIPSRSDQYLLCNLCNYVGKRIVFHYANWHNFAEIPYITLTDEQCKEVQRNVHPPTEYTNSIMKEFNIYWIPDADKKKTQCQYSTYKTSRRHELIQHIFNKHRAPENTSYICVVCDYSCGDICELYDHVTFHTGEYRYKCGYCPYTVFHQDPLKTHMETLHMSQDQLFFSVSDMKLKNDWLYGYICLRCKFFQISETNLRKHVDSHANCSYSIRLINLMKVTIKGNDLHKPDKMINLKNSSTFGIQHIKCETANTMSFAQEDKFGIHENETRSSEGNFKFSNTKHLEN
jgi:hypothetical protein